MLHDSLVKGKVRITDNKTKKVLVDVHNLVLENGRKLFFDFLVRSLLEQNSLVAEDNYNQMINKNSLANKITGVFFGSNQTATTSDYEPITDYEVKSIHENGSIIQVSTGQEIIDENKFSFYVKFSISIKRNYLPTLTSLAEVGLVLDDDSLFSRACFDPLQIEGDTDFTFEYFVYI